MRRTFYCDGSCKGNGYANSSGGFGVVEINSDDELVYQYQEFKSPTTNNEMELMAILHILQRLDKEKNLDYHIFRELPVVFSVVIGVMDIALEHILANKEKGEIKWLASMMRSRSTIARRTSASLWI